MKPFWRSFWASSLASIVIGLFLFFIAMIIIVAISSSLFEEKPYVIKDKSVLHIKFDKLIAEKSFADFNPNGEKLLSESFGIREIKLGLLAAQKDNKIKGVLLNVDNLNTGYASLEEIRNSIIDFKENSKKFVYAYSEIYDQKPITYLQTDKLYLNPAGMIDFKGLSAEIMFLKGAIDKLNIDLEIIRGPNNDYKSAIEPFTKDQMSQKAKSKLKNISRIYGAICFQTSINQEEYQKIR